jgi:hypothetical protein
MNRSHLILPFVLIPILPGTVHAANIIVMISGGFKSTYEALAPGFEEMTGSHLVMVPGPSEGSTKEAIPNRLARGEAADVLIMVGPELDKLITRGDAVGGSETELALSPIGMCVRGGAPVPDISTVDKLRQVLLNAKSIAYSDSSSGVYIETTLFRKLGIESDARQSASNPGYSRRRDRGARQSGNRLPGGRRDPSGQGSDIRRPHPGSRGIPDALLRGRGQPVQEPGAGNATYRISGLTDRVACAGEDGPRAAQEIAQSRVPSVPRRAAAWCKKIEDAIMNDISPAGFHDLHRLVRSVRVWCASIASADAATMVADRSGERGSARSDMYRGDLSGHAAGTRSAGMGGLDRAVRLAGDARQFAAEKPVAGCQQHHRMCHRDHADRELRAVDARLRCRPRAVARLVDGGLPPWSAGSGRMASP